MSKAKYFYTIQSGDGMFICSDIDKGLETNKISEAIRFNSEKELNNYWETYICKIMRENMDLKRIEVECLCLELEE